MTISLKKLVGAFASYHTDSPHINIKHSEISLEMMKKIVDVQQDKEVRQNLSFVNEQGEKISIRVVYGAGDYFVKKKELDVETTFNNDVETTEVLYAAGTSLKFASMINGKIDRQQFRNATSSINNYTDHSDVLVIQKITTSADRYKDDPDANPALRDIKFKSVVHIKANKIFDVNTGTVKKEIEIQVQEGLKEHEFQSILNAVQSSDFQAKYTPEVFVEKDHKKVDITGGLLDNMEPTVSSTVYAAGR